MSRYLGNLSIEDTTAVGSGQVASLQVVTDQITALSQQQQQDLNNVNASITALSMDLNAQNDAQDIRLDALELTDATQNSQIASNALAIAQETNSRQLADNALTQQINSNYNDLFTRIQTEQTRAINAEQELQTQITAEVLARQNADNLLQDNLEAVQAYGETTRELLFVEIGVKQQQIVEESLARVQKDGELEARIDENEMRINDHEIRLDAVELELGNSTALATPNTLMKRDMTNKTAVGKLLTDDIESIGNTLTLAGDNATQTVNVATGSSVQSINIGNGSGSTIINLGFMGDTVNIAGAVNNIESTNVNITDKSLVLNKNGTVGTSGLSGLYIEENGVSNDSFIRISGDRTALEAKGKAGVPISINQSLSTTDTPTFPLVNTNISGSSNTFRSPLSGDLSGGNDGLASVVEMVGGMSKLEIAQSVLDTQGATSANGINNLVKRDANGQSDFQTCRATTFDGRGSATTFGLNSTSINIGASATLAQTVNIGGGAGATTINLGQTGSVNDVINARVPINGDLNGTATTCITIPSLSGDVSNTGNVVSVNLVGGKTSAQIAQSVDDTINATSGAIANTLVKRDANASSAFTDLNVQRRIFMDNFTVPIYSIWTGGNVFFGNGSGSAFMNNPITRSGAGMFNTVYGSNAGMNVNSGNRNTILGSGAGETVSMANDNTLIGYQANVGSDTIVNSIAIGKDALISESNAVQIGNSLTENCYLSGIVRPSVGLNSPFVSSTGAIATGNLGHFFTNSMTMGLEGSAFTGFRNISPSAVGESLDFAIINSNGGAQMLNLRLAVAGTNLNWSGDYEIPINAVLAGSTTNLQINANPVVIEPLREAYINNRFQLLISASTPNSVLLTIRKTMGIETGTISAGFYSAGQFSNRNIKNNNDLFSINQVFAPNAEIYRNDLIPQANTLYNDGFNYQTNQTSTYTLNGTTSANVNFIFLKQGRVVNIFLPPVLFNTNTTGAMTINAQLPLGMRPSTLLRVPVSIFNNGNALNTGTLTITLGGNMSISAGNYSSGLGGINGFANQCGIPGSTVNFCIF